METINMYSFSELNEEVKEKVIESFRYINVDHEWYDFICDEAESLGITIETFDIDKNYINGDLSNSAIEVAKNIIENHGKDCETYKTAQKFIAEYQPVDEDNEDQINELETDFSLDILGDYLILLCKSYEYLISDEAVIECIEANDYHFTETGKFF